MIFIKLPSGRMLSYVKPRIGKNAFGGGAVTYMGVVSTKKWERIGSYGPKFVERSDGPDAILAFENTAPDGDKMTYDQKS